MTTKTKKKTAKKLYKTTVVVVTDYNPKGADLENLGIAVRLSNAVEIGKITQSFSEKNLNRVLGRKAGGIVRELLVQDDNE